MSCGGHKVECAGCGFSVTTKDQKELVSMVQWHVKNAHHKEVGEKEVMGMSKHP